MFGIIKRTYEDKMKKILKLVFGLALAIISIFIGHYFIKNFLKKELPSHQIMLPLKEKNHVYLNIFVHGTFGTLLGLLSLPSVLKDQIKGTVYRDVNKNMRNDDHFFTTQPMLDRGLQALTPTFDLAATNQKNLAAYPITQAFDLFCNETNLKNFEQRYYTFGWSGLISQHSRRFESVRLYNALQEEIAVLKKQNLIPRIRILAHSHGGNLCLNLGSIAPLLDVEAFDSFHKYSLDEATNESMKKMHKILNTLPSKEVAILTKGQKKLDYKPTEKKLEIDELILLGTPIQPETENFLLSNIFKVIYNVYSSEDTIQQADWVSTKNPSSKQRADEKFLLRASELARQNKGPRIIQVKVMYEKPVIESQDKKLSIDQSNSQLPSFLDALLGTRPISKDPNHKELWCLHRQRAHHKKNDSESSFLSPLPTVAILPPILSLLDNNPALLDVDFNVTPTKNSIGFFLTKHNEEKIQDSLLIKMSLLNDIKLKVNQWYPEDITPQKEFSSIYQHLTKNKESIDKQHQKAA